MTETLKGGPMKTFDEQPPGEWQFIFVVSDDEFVQSGFYRFSDHHTYPHEIHKKARDYSTRIECFTGEAEWFTVAP